MVTSQSQLARRMTRSNLSTKFWDTLGAQNKAMVVTSQQVLSASRAYGTLPLIVLSATLPADEGREQWTKLNGTLAARSSNGRHRIVDGASHMSLALELDQAQVTTTAILQVLESARTGTPLQ